MTEQLLDVADVGAAAPKAVDITGQFADLQPPSLR
jgi:hypothetical protein